MTDGRFITVGDFSYAGAERAIGIARLTANGAHDPTFRYPNDAAGPAGQILPLTDGRVLLLKQEFVYTIGPLDVRPPWPVTPTYRLIRLNVDGTEDPTFPNTVFNDTVSTWQRGPDGRYVLVGNFTAVGITPSRGIARLNTDGTLDASHTAELPSDQPHVHSFAIASNGSVVMVGWSGTPLYPQTFFLRFQPDGSHDATFNPPPPTIASGLPRILAAFDDGRAVIFGTELLLLRADGSIDPAFQPALPTGGLVTRAIPVPDGRVLVELQFGSFPLPEIDATVWLLNVDGSRLVDYRAALQETGLIRLQAALPGGQVLLSRLVPDFRRTIPQPLYYTGYKDVKFVRASLTGERQAEFVAPLGGPGFVSRILPAENDGVLISGDFDVVNGVLRPGIVQLREDGSVDPAFTPPTDEGRRYHIEARRADGRILTTRKSPFAVDRDGQHVRLLANGSVDASLSPDSTWATTPGQVLAIDAQNRLLATMERGVAGSGQFAYVLETFAVYRADGSLERTFPVRFERTQPQLWPLRERLLNGARALDNGGFLLTGGFDLADGRPAPGMVRLLPDGTVDPDFAAGLRPDYVTGSPLLLRDGRVLVDFTASLPDGSAARTWRLFENGTIDPDFAPRPGDFFASGWEQSDGSILSLDRTVFDEDPVIRRWDALGVREAQFIAAIDVIAAYALDVRSVLRVDAGHLYVGGNFRDIAGRTRIGMVRLLTDPNPPLSVEAPSFVIAGRESYLSASFSQAREATFQWQRNGIDLPGANIPVLRITNTSPAEAGDYRVVITVGATTIASAVTTLVVGPRSVGICNFSARSLVRSGHPPQIVGFVLRDTGAPTPVLLRATGPSLMQFGLQPPLLVAPQLRLHMGSSPALAGVSVLSPEILSRSEEVGAFPVLNLSAIQNLECGLAVDLNAGIYTAQVSALDGAEGVGLSEFYDASPLPASRGVVRNVSLRGYVGAGQNTMIGGFFVSGTGPITVLVRAVGPELAQFSVPDCLPDPVLTLFQGSAQIMLNNDANSVWFPGRMDPATAATLTGAFPLTSDSKSAALVATLEPGAYTVHATGAANGAGEVLLEIYVVDP